MKSLKALELRSAAAIFSVHSPTTISLVLRTNSHHNIVSACALSLLEIHGQKEKLILLSGREAICNCRHAYKTR